MKILVINSGSSSLKYCLYNMEDGSIMAKGLCERIGIDGVLRHNASGAAQLQLELPMQTHQQALEAVFSKLIDAVHGVISNIAEINAVGHRVGHGGDFFSDSVLIDQRVKDGIRACYPLAPLHNPPAMMGIEACSALLGDGIPQVAVCDTAFHQSIPRHAYTYSLPRELCKKHNIRKYGFHGTSHKFVAQRAADMLQRPLGELNIVSCHLGNGSSLAAIEHGKSVDTSMGYAALEGIIMGTRCGDMDPCLAMFLMQQEGYTAEEVERIYYKESGLLGISGVSSDLREIEQAAKAGNEDARNAIDVLCYGIRKYIGAYMAVMGGLDAIIFTAGIGENSSLVRGQSLSGLQKLGIVLDETSNANTRGQAAVISTAGSPVKVLVIPTDEEWMIANDTMLLTAK